MPEPLLPLIAEPDQLEALLGNSRLAVIDLSKRETYAQYHLPGAHHLDYGQIVGVNKPAMGLLPDAETFAQVLSSLGITLNTHVVAYDDEGGGRACRLLWTLDVAGHRGFSLLNGGLHAWANEEHRMENAPVATPAPSQYTVNWRDGPAADHEYILAHLQDQNVRLLDVRSAAEYAGTKVFAARGGHIPGAANMEWTTAMDMDRNLRLRNADELRALLEPLGVTPDKEIITYCQTHHRSAHTYIMLKSLGFERVRGYAPSWSDWGNRTDTPVEV